MRKNFGAKPWTYPQPVFILASWNEDGTADAMNAAWGGVSDDRELSFCISAGHKTTANILARRAFTVSMATADQMAACDYVGIVSGNEVKDKLEKAGWHVTPSSLRGRAPHRRAAHGGGVPAGELRCRELPPGGRSGERERRRGGAGRNRPHRPGQTAAHRL